MNTKIVVDSSASLYTLQGVDFECVPLKIITDDAEYLDNGTMDAVGMAQAIAAIAQHMAAGQPTFAGIDPSLVVGSWRVNIPYSSYTGE